MPWKEVSTMSQRHEFIRLAQQPGTSLQALCRRFEISPPTAYKWLARGMRLPEPRDSRSVPAAPSRRPSAPSSILPTANGTLTAGGSIFVIRRLARLICATPPNKPQCVNHVPEHPLPMSPVYTVRTNRLWPTRQFHRSTTVQLLGERRSP